MDLYVKIDSSEPLDVTLVKGKVPHMEHHRWSKCGSEYFYFVLFLFYKLRHKNKQTNRKNISRDTATDVANYSGPGLKYKEIICHSKTKSVNKTKYTGY